MSLFHPPVFLDLKDVPIFSLLCEAQPFQKPAVCVLLLFWTCYNPCVSKKKKKKKEDE